MSEYSEQSYWDARYQLDTEPYEWLQPFSALRPFIAPLINPTRRLHSTTTTPVALQRSIHQRRRSLLTDEQPPPVDRPPSMAEQPLVVRVLVLGCGCSELSYEVWRLCEGRGEVHSVDFSVQCVEEMRRRYPQPGLHFHCQDVRGLTFPADYFDLALDKATLDCLHTLDALDGAAQLKLAVRCLHRTLRLGGALLSISHAPPEQRSAHFVLDRLEVVKEQLEASKKEKALRRASVAAPDAASITAGASSPPAGASPKLVNKRASITSAGVSRHGSRRASMVSNNIESMPVPLLTQPVVHRLPKPAASDSASDDNHSRSLTRTSSLASASASSAAASAIDESPLLPARRASLLLDGVPLDGADGGAAAAEAGGADELSAVYDNADHYLYVVRKELVAHTPQTGLHSVGDAAGGRRSSLIALTAGQHRQTSSTLVALAT